MVYYSVMKKNQAILMKFTNSSLSKKKNKTKILKNTYFIQGSKTGKTN